MDELASTQPASSKATILAFAGLWSGKAPELLKFFHNYEIKFDLMK